MIIGGTLPAKMEQPQHRLDMPTLGNVMVATTEEANRLRDVRDYSEHVCPGRHCAGRLGIVKSGHRHTMAPVHYLSPDQLALRDKPARVKR